MNQTKTTQHFITLEWAEALPPMNYAVAWTTYLSQCDRGWRFPHVTEIVATTYDNVSGFDTEARYWVEERDTQGMRLVYDFRLGCIECIGDAKALLRLVRTVPHNAT